MNEEKTQLNMRRAYMIPDMPNIYCAHYVNKRDGNEVYECMRPAEWFCEGCYQPENMDRPLCRRHRRCDVCGRLAQKN